jgi:small-conductance mechanosensitive channel
MIILDAILQMIQKDLILLIGLKAVLIVLAAFLVNYIVNYSLNKALKRIQKKSNTEERRLMITRINFLKTALRYLIYSMAMVYILFLIPSFKAFSISLLAGAGILAIIIGFAAQKTLANIIAGISIAIYTPFRINDRLKIGEEFGDVEELTLRHVVLRTWDNRRVIIPNSIISEKEIVNYSIKDEKMLGTLDISVGYESDLEKAKKIILDLANKHPR